MCVRVLVCVRKCVCFQMLLELSAYAAVSRGACVRVLVCVRKRVCFHVRMCVSM